MEQFSRIVNGTVFEIGFIRKQSSFRANFENGRGNDYRLLRGLHFEGILKVLWKFKVDSFRFSIVDRFALLKYAFCVEYFGNLMVDSIVCTEGVGLTRNAFALMNLYFQSINTNIAINFLFRRLGTFL
jgi:hypothetical protein